jgi:hypothetical protein
MLAISRLPENAGGLAPRVAGIWPTTPHAALAALEHVAAEMSRTGDARAAFPDVYAVITQKVIERLADDSGYFHAPEFISMLVGVFTNRYLQTLDWSQRSMPQDSRGWALAYRLAGKNALPATAHAALGISAHINYDLALGIYQVVVQLGAQHNQSRLALFKHDHDAVNALLAASFPESARRLRATHGCAIANLLPDAAIGRLTRFLLKVLSGWRDDVWTNMLALLDATCPAERDAVIARMDHRAAAAGATIARLSAASGVSARLIRHGVPRRRVQRLRPWYWMRLAWINPLSIAACSSASLVFTRSAKKYGP